MEFYRSLLPSVQNRIYLYESPSEINFELKCKNVWGVYEDVTEGRITLQIYKNRTNTKFRRQGGIYLESGSGSLLGTIVVHGYKTSSRYRNIERVIYLSAPVDNGSSTVHLTLKCNALSSTDFGKLRDVIQNATSSSSCTTVALSDNRPQQRNLVCSEFLDENQLVRSGPPAGRSSAFLADAMCRGAASLTDKMVCAAESKASQLHAQGDAINERLLHRRYYDEPKYVDPNLKNAAAVACALTGAAATVTSAAVHGISYALSYLGTTFGPTLKEGAVGLLTKEYGFDEEKTRNGIEDFCNITGGILSAGATVLTGVETSARIIGPGISRNISGAVGLQYGEDMRELTENALGTAGNVAIIGYNIKSYRKQIAVKGTPAPRSQSADAE